MSKYIYGMHEECPVDVMPDGWILQLVEIHHGPEPHPGLPRPSDDRERIIRVQYSFGDEGQTFPRLGNYNGYYNRFASLVGNTPWAHIWIVGNEPNVKVEGMFDPGYTAKTYNDIRVLIHNLPGHENDQVLLPPIGPWNVDTGIGWMDYFTQLIDLCDDVDGFALHTYTRSANPAEITDSSLCMDPPYEMYHSSFLTYEDWMRAIPIRYKGRPVYITEFDENDAWVDENTGVVQAAYEKIDRWNKRGFQPIRALILYRWPPNDKYYIEGKSGVIDDFFFAQMEQYTWKENGMADEWTVVENINCEGGFYDQDGIGELTIPLGTAIHWREAPGDGILDRVEADAKDAQLGHSEVYEGRYSAVLMWSHSTGQAALVSAPILISLLGRVRASCQFMYTAGDEWQGGAKMGIALESNHPDAGGGIFSQGQYEWPTEGENPFADPSIMWGEWKATYTGMGEREWVELSVPAFHAGGYNVRLICLFNSDQAIPAQGHFDVMMVEMETGDGPPPPPPTTGSIFEKLDAIEAHAGAIELLTGEIRNQLLTGAIQCIPLEDIGG